MATEFGSVFLEKGYLLTDIPPAIDVDRRRAVFGWPMEEL